MIEKQIENDGYLVGFYPTNADLAIATGFLCPFKAVFTQHLSEEFPKFSIWLNQIYQDFRLEHMHPEFVDVKIEPKKSLKPVEGAVARERRVSYAILGITSAQELPGSEGVEVKHPEG